MTDFQKIIAPAVCVLLLFSCQTKDKKIPTILTGRPVELLNEQVGQAGILYAEKPGDSLDGLLMYVPDAGFAEGKRFKISYQPITSHTFGPDFNPVSPLITISCGGGFSDSVITMEVPVHLTEGQFAMGFLYNEKKGELEGMPLLKIEKDRVVIALRNFEHSTAIEGNPVAAQVTGPDEAAVTKFVLSAASEKSLPGDYDSGFRPGVDDSPSKNMGSMIEPVGHCSGQSQLMLWYFATKKTKGSPGLFKLLEADGGPSTPQFWKDDTKAIRLSSLLQNTEKNRSYFRKGMDIGFTMAGIGLSDMVTINAFRYAIKLTRKPQFIEIHEDGYRSVGHAMVVYKVEGSTLYIADPNYPGKTRKIEYDPEAGDFSDYESALTAGGAGKRFRDFYYIGSSALISFSDIDKFWKTMEAGALGDGKFPAYRISVFKNEEWISLEEGFEMEAAEEGSPLAVRVESENKAYTTIYDGTETLTKLSENTFRITPGRHRLGIYVLDLIENNWMGFQWVNVNIKSKNEEERPKPNFQPNFSEFDMALEVNGTKYPVGTYRFDIAREHFTVSGTAPNHEHKLDIRISNWHGEGQYENFHADWTTRMDPLTGSYITKTNSKLIITKWGDGQLIGSFSFEGYDDYFKKTATIKGDIYFKYVGK